MRRDILDYIKKYIGMLEYPRFYYTGVTHVQKNSLYIYIYIYSYNKKLMAAYLKKKKTV